MVRLREEDFPKIKEAVAAAEKHTSGEISTAVITESSDYAFYELRFAVVIGFVFFIVMMLFGPSLESHVKNLFWDYAVTDTLLVFGVSTFLVISLVYFIVNGTFLDRMVIPKAVMKQRVFDRARLHFLDSGIYKTRDRTGILIFVSLLERSVFILADEGISRKIDQQQWDAIVEDMIRGIRAGRLVDCIVEAIGTCGELLSRHFPIKPDDVNELQDDVFVLDK